MAFSSYGSTANTDLSKAKGLAESVDESNTNLSPNLKESVVEIHSSANNQTSPVCAHDFIRLAGILGAMAVALGAYGFHVFAKEDISEELKQVYNTANLYHLLHSLALLGVPLTRRPLLTGSLLTLGMLLFCGTCYFHALTGIEGIRLVTPIGGVLFVVGWVSMAI